MEANQHVAVFDTGSSSTKVGLSHQATPTTYPTLVSKDGTLVGHEIQYQGTRKNVLYGLVQNWEHMEKIWEHGFKLMKIQPSDQPMVLNKPYPCPKYEEAKMVQIMFEEFDVPALHLNCSALYSLYSSGSLTGLVVDSGFCETQFYPIYEGHVLERCLGRGLPVAGEYLTHFLQDVLTKKGYNCDFETANYIKEKSFYVSQDVNKEKATEEVFTLPDGNNVTLSKEKYLIPEEFYKSSIEYAGIHEFPFYRIYKCDAEIRKMMSENVILSGGTTLIEGFVQRLQTEMTTIGPEFKNGSEIYTATIKSPPYRDVSAWVGGTILASLSTFLNMCMTKEEYNEHGPGLASKKFF